MGAGRDPLASSGSVTRGAVRIVSLNAWGGAMFAELAAWLPTCGADIVCLQEVTRVAGLGGSTRFADGERSLPQRASLFDDVRRLLPRHRASFVVSDAGPVTTDDGVEHRQDFGLAMFVAETHPVIGERADFVHGHFVDHVEWQIADRPRLAQAVRVFDRSSNTVVTVTHLHGLRDPSGKGDTPERRAQAQRLVSLIQSVREPGDLAVVCGDFNLLPGSETFEILAGIGLADLVGTADTRTSRYTKPSRHANYLLVSDPSRVRRFEALAEPEVSDHRALVLDL
ncbi:MAG: endonuclease/exonuclease/phosphatase family protein [Acidimicrobiales bacterium]